MIRTFSDVRRDIFGSIRIIELIPAGSIAILDGDTLRAQIDGLVGDVDVIVGKHNLLVEHTGFQTRQDAIVIEPSATLERSYVLTKSRGTGWYALSGGAVAGVIAGAALALGAPAGTFEGGARSLDIDPSIRATGMGLANNAVFWGDDVDDWANPAMLGIQNGVRYKWGRTAFKDLANVTYTSHRLVIGAGGIGIGIPGTVGDDGSALLDNKASINPDEGNPTGTLGSQEGIRSWGLGMSLPSMFEALMQASGYQPPRISRTFDAAFGVNRKHVRVALAPTAVAETDVTDYGMLLRATLLDEFARTESGWPRRLDVSYGYSIQNAEDAIIQFNNNPPERVTRTSRNGFAVRYATGAPAVGSRRHWLAPESLTPLVSIGVAVDVERPNGLFTSAYYGFEVTLANLLSLRTGSVQDRGLNDLHTTTFGVGLAYRYKNVAGIRYDWSNFPEEIATGTTRSGVMVYVDPLSLARRAR